MSTPYMVPVDFNPALFMYLNPEHVATSNINTSWEAQAWAQSNDATTVVYTLDEIPANFDARLYLANAKAVADISTLSKKVYNAMLVEGYTPTAIEKRATFIDNIYQPARHLSNNIFQFNNPSTGGSTPFIMTPCNVQVGDILSLKTAVRSTSALQQALVVGLIDNNTMELSNLKSGGAFNKPGVDYLVRGIKVFDIERVAAINYMRAVVGAANVTPVETMFTDTTFNPDLYRLLYPVSRTLTDAEAYIEYTGLASNNLTPVGNVGDLGAINSIVGSNVPNLPVDNISVTYQLRLPEATSSFVFKGSTVYGISEDDTIKSATLYPSVAEPRLVTEYAIKKYIDRSYDEEAIFNDVIVNGMALFNGPVMLKNTFIVPTISTNYLTVNSNVDVLGTAQFSNAVTAESDVHVKGVLRVSNDVLIEGMLSVDSNAVFNAPVVFEDPVTFNNTVSMSDNVIISGERFEVSAATTFSSNVVVDAPMTVLDSLLLVGDVEITGRLHTSNDVLFGDSVAFLLDAHFYGSVATSSTVEMLYLEASNVGISNVSISNASVEELIVETSYLEQSYLSNASVSNMCVQEGAFSNAYVSGTAIIKNTVISSASVSNLGASNVSVDALVANIGILEEAQLMDATVSNMTASNAVINDLYASVIVVEALNAVDTTMSNVVVSDAFLSLGHITVLGASNFIANVTTSNIQCEGDIVMTEDVLCLSNLHVVGTTFGPRIGIGFVSLSNGGGDDFLAGTGAGGGNATWCNVDVLNVLTVGTSNTHGQDVLVVNGNIVADNLNNVSDRRFKRDIETIASKGALQKLMSINPVKYSMAWNHDQTISGYGGFLAQELEEIIPEAVHTIGDRVVPCNINVLVLWNGFDNANIGVHLVVVDVNGGTDSLVLNIGDRVVLAGMYLGVEMEYIGVYRGQRDGYTVDGLLFKVIERTLTLQNHTVLTIQKIMLKGVKSVNYQYITTLLVAALQEVYGKQDDVMLCNAQ